MFEPTGELITNGVSGCLRWPVKQDALSGELSIGPPRILMPAGSICMTSTDRTGQTVAVAAADEARIALEAEPSRSGRLLTAGAFRLVPTENGWPPAIIALRA